MLNTIDISSLWPLLVPRRDASKLAGWFTDTRLTDRASQRHLRANDAEFFERAHTRKFRERKARLLPKVFRRQDLSDEELEDFLFLAGKTAGVPDDHIFEVQQKIESGLANFEQRQYPSGIFGYLSDEVLPKIPLFSWLKPTLDRLIEVSRKLEATTDAEARYWLWRQSDVGRTQTGAQALSAWQRSGSKNSLQPIEMSLQNLVRFQLVALPLAGAGLTQRQVQERAILADDGQDVRAVERWFGQLRTLLAHKNWARIDATLRTIKNVESSLADGTKPDKTVAGSRMHEIRTGARPLSRDAMVALLMEFVGNEDAIYLPALADLEQKYQLAVVFDNVQDMWMHDSKVKEEWPTLDLREAFSTLYQLAKDRD